MDPFLVCVLAAIVVGVIVAAARTTPPGLLDPPKIPDWSETARLLGLRYLPDDAFGPQSLEGTISSVSITVRHSPGSPYAISETTFELSADYRIPFDITHGTPGELGDEDFDRIFRVTGPDLEIAAALDRDTRAKLIALAPIRVENGKLRRETHGVLDATAMISKIQELVALFHALSIDPAQRGARLLSSLQKESEPLVKDRQLRILFRTIQDPQLVDRAIDAALASSLPESRLLGACVAGERGLATLEQLTKDHHASDEVRAVALEKLPADRFDTATLLALRANNAGVKLRAHIARRLTDESALIAALDDADEDVQIAAARSLALLGSVAAVEPLRARTDGVFKSALLKFHAEEAVRAIQARASSAERGTLSIAGEDERGALSVASADRGALSVDPKK